MKKVIKKMLVFLTVLSIGVVSLTACEKNNGSSSSSVASTNSN